ncbi:CFI-box-CTERM domain-containing protein [Chloroflexota bacterium]
MKKRILVTLVLITLLIGGIVPRTAFAGEEEEGRFVTDMESRIATARTILARWREVLGNISADPQRGRAALSIREVRGTTTARLSFGDCGFGGVPVPFGDIADLWNSTVCTGLASMVAKFSSISNLENTDDADFILGLIIIRATIGEVEAEVDLIEAMVHERAIDVANMRREQEEEREREEALKKEAEEAEGAVKKKTGLDDSSCFIATAAYGTPAAKEIDTLRQFRDDFLRESSLGNGFIDFYYQTSPPLADFIAEHETLRTLVREGLVDPVVAIVELTRNGWEK